MGSTVTITAADLSANVRGVSIFTSFTSLSLCGVRLLIVKLFLRIPSSAPSTVKLHRMGVVAMITIDSLAGQD